MSDAAKLVDEVGAMSRGAAEYRVLEVGYQQMRERAEQAEHERADLLGALREAQSALGDAHYWFKRLAGGPCADYSMECKMGEAESRARAAIARIEDDMRAPHTHGFGCAAADAEIATLRRERDEARANSDHRRYMYALAYERLNAAVARAEKAEREAAFGKAEVKRLMETGTPYWDVEIDRRQTEALAPEERGEGCQVCAGTGAPWGDEGGDSCHRCGGTGRGTR